MPMAISQLVANLAERGITFGYRLVIDGPAGAIDDDAARAIRQHRAEIAEALAKLDRLKLGLEHLARMLACDDQGFDWAAGEQAYDIKQKEGVNT